MHAWGRGADERLQESAAMIAYYPARIPVCRVSLFPFFFSSLSLLASALQTLGGQGLSLTLLLFFVFASLIDYY